MELEGRETTKHRGKKSERGRIVIIRENVRGISTRRITSQIRTYRIRIEATSLRPSNLP
jgi:hypothetical protein